MKKAEFLESSMFPKLDRDRNIKVIAVVVSKIKRDLIFKEDTIFPTVATEAVLLTCAIYAK